MTERTPVLDPALVTVLGYAQRGWGVFPVHTEDEHGCSCRQANCDRPGKHPKTEHGLLDASTDETQIKAWSQKHPGCNWGITPGPRSGVFVMDIDPGGEQALADWKKEYGSDWLKTLRAATPRGEHFFFQYPANLEATGSEIVNSVGEIAPGIDIRGKGGYAIVAPSRRCNLGYRWLDRGSDTPIITAPEWLLAKIVRPISSRIVTENRKNGTRPSTSEIIETGARNSSLTSLAGTMRRRGMSQEAIESALQTENTLRCDPPLAAAEVSGIVTSVSRYPAESDDSWPDALPISWQPVEPFNLEHLPESLRPIVKDVSERMQTPPDFAAATSIVALAGVVNRRARVQARQSDHTWEMPLNLWGGLVGGPGLLKTPLVKSIIQPLTVIESGWREENKLAQSRFELRSAQVEIEQKIWAQNYKQSHDSEIPRPQLPAPPSQKRLLITDATSEKVHELLMENPQGLFMVRDELCGWISTLDKPGRESDRGFYLQSWSGNEGYTIDRIGRGSLFVPHVCLSVFGNIQPTRLQHYISDSLTDANNDGLFQRLQLLVCPDVSADWTLVDRLPDANALATVQRVFSHLAELPCEPPVRLRFQAQAQIYFNGWLGDLERELRSPDDLIPALVTHLAKYRGLLPRLAALFELTDRAARGPVAGQTLEISLEHTRQAASVCHYLRSHAQRIYTGLGSPDMAAAKVLSGKLQRGHLTGPFSTRTIYRKCWAGMTNPTSARRVLDLLASFGWVRSIPSDENVDGRPAELWAVNPKAVTQ
jgi:Protein of unknown function (DUF3987)/Bifunctional DNA primase/polymerase, N-terminal/Primase C terminal 1 (PriCT-1)